MAGDGQVQVAPDSTGKKVGTFEVTRAVDAVVEERQKIVLVDPSDPGTAAGDNGAGVVPMTGAAQQTGYGLSVRGMQAIEDLAIAMRQALNFMIKPVYLEAATSRARVTLDAIAAGLTLSTVTTVGGVTNVGTVASVTNQANIGGVDAKQAMIFPMDATAWAATVRNRIV
jgi:hypothetical protein